MSRALTRRLTRLEQQAHAGDRTPWSEVHAAAERLRGRAVATLRARLQRQEPPVRDEAQSRTDQALVVRWCRAQGTYRDPQDARARLKAQLTTIATRHATAPPQGISARSAH